MTLSELTELAAWWTDMPSPNRLCVQRHWAALPAVPRWAKILSGDLHGVLPTEHVYGYVSLGKTLFKGFAFRHLPAT